MQIDTQLLNSAGQTLAYNATRDDHKPENRRAEGGKRF